MHLLRMCTFVSTKKRCCTCRQVNNILCDASAKPSNRRPCNATSCAVEARALKLRFTPWSACEAECGNGYNGRAAVCANADGIAVDPTACSGYTGASMSADVASEMAYVILNGIDKCFTCVSFPFHFPNFFKLRRSCCPLLYGGTAAHICFHSKRHMLCQW